jgi:hypothetical protein
MTVTGWAVTWSCVVTDGELRGGRRTLKISLLVFYLLYHVAVVLSRYRLMFSLIGLTSVRCLTQVFYRVLSQDGLPFDRCPTQIAFTVLSRDGLPRGRVLSRDRKIEGAADTKVSRDWGGLQIVALYRYEVYNFPD